ncbi:MAG: SLC13 family permease [Pyrinomonadaceae bacterium]
MSTGSLSKSDLWALAEQRRAAAKGAAGGARGFRWVVDAILPLALTMAAGIGVLLPAALPTPARVSLFSFALAVILWSTTSLNAAYVALGALMLLVLAGGSPQEQLFDALASDVIWLMIGAFVLGGAVQQTGLAARLTAFVTGRARTVRGTFWLLTTALVPLSFFIPSTSGRAAVTLPVFRSLAAAAGDQRVTRALALLMPTVILVATINTLIGAGSHLIANDLLEQIAKQRISFTWWAIYGVPFGVTAAYVSCWVVMRLFLRREQLDAELRVPAAKRAPLTRAEWTTLAVAAMMVALWVSEAWHGLEIATVSVAGALVLTLPALGVLSWKEGLKSVSWNLIVFVGAALVLGQALIKTGAAPWIIDGLFAASGVARAESPLLVLLVLSFISLTSHIYMTSHTARAAALVPGILYLAGSLGLNPVAALFISTAGMDYCLTFPVSSKALLMFQELETETYQPSDLLRLSAVLLIAHLALIVLFYFTYWRWVGLTL